MIQVKKIALVAASIVILAAWLTGRPLQSRTEDRILVLGFDSTLLNDIQDRLLRETVMRDLQVSGLPIVPVMEIESIFHEDLKQQIRKLNRDDMKRLCGDLRAGYACCGSLVAETVSADERIRDGINYICTVTFFNRGKNSFTSITIKATGEDNLYRFYAALSRNIVADIKKLL
jgi:hypothetical protein